MDTLFEVNNAFHTIVVVLMLYAALGVPGMTIIGMILNTVSLVKRHKKNGNITINIVLFVLLLPIWWQFFWKAALSV